MLSNGNGENQIAAEQLKWMEGRLKDLAANGGASNLEAPFEADGAQINGKAPFAQLSVAATAVLSALARGPLAAAYSEWKSDSEQIGVCDTHGEIGKRAQELLIQLKTAQALGIVLADTARTGELAFE